MEELGMFFIKVILKIFLGLRRELKKKLYGKENSYFWSKRVRRLLKERKDLLMENFCKKV